MLIEWHSGTEGLTSGGGRGVDVVHALVLVAAPSFLHKLQGIRGVGLQGDYSDFSAMIAN